MKKILILIAIGFSLSGYCQKPGQENALVTIRGNIGIPRVIGSGAFRTSFAGLYEGNLSVNVKIIEKFFVGLGYQNTQFQNNKFLKFQYFNASIPYNTRLLMSGIFIKLGYDRFFSDKGYTSFSLNSGMMLNKYFNVNADTSAANKPFGLLNFVAPYIQPELAINFIVEKRLAFSIMLSYTTMFNKFDPKAPRFAQFQEVQDSRNRYFMNWINIGFGFTVLLDKKSKQ